MSGGKLLTAIMVLLAASVMGSEVVAQTPAGGGVPHVFQRISVAKDEDSMQARGVFSRFFVEFAATLEDALRRDHTQTWDFWVDLRPDPRHHNRFHILIIGRCNGLTVRVCDLDPGPSLKIPSAVAKAVRTSLAVTRDATFRRLAGQDTIAPPNAEAKR